MPAQLAGTAHDDIALKDEADGKAPKTQGDEDGQEPSLGTIRHDLMIGGQRNRYRDCTQV